MEKPKAWIISVGNELLIGRTINTNAAWLGRKLTFLGFEVERIVTVPDNIEDIAEEVKRAVERAKIVITTGGLGPTYDDRTLEGVAKALGLELAVNDDALEMVRRFYSAKGLELTPHRVKMAMLPRGAKPLKNPIGAAPGALLKVGGSMIISLPGVPSEMKAMFEAEVEPVLKEVAPRLEVVECTIRVHGVPESSLAPIIDKAHKASERVYIKSHPEGYETGNPIITIKALASAENKPKAIEEAMRSLKYIVDGARKLGASISEEGCS